MLLASIFPLARFNDGTIVFEAIGIYFNGVMTDSTWALMAIGAITSIIAILTIFLYKGRLLQIRLTILNTLMIVGFYIFAAFIFYRILTTPFELTPTSINVPSIGFAAFLPLVAIIVNILAIRRIYADEALVRSLSRLR